MFGAFQTVEGGRLWAVPRAEGLSCRGDSVAHSL